MDAPPSKRKLIDIVRNYQGLLVRVHEYLKENQEHANIAKYLGLSLSNYYSKRKGERRFTYSNVQKLLELFGTDEEKQEYDDFIEVRNNIYKCLKESGVSIAKYRRIVNLNHHKLMTRRRDHPESWRIEDLEKIGLYMESVAHCID